MCGGEFSMWRRLVPVDTPNWARYFEVRATIDTNTHTGYRDKDGAPAWVGCCDGCKTSFTCLTECTLYCSHWCGHSCTPSGWVAAQSVHLELYQLHIGRVKTKLLPPPSAFVYERTQTQTYTQPQTHSTHTHTHTIIYACTYTLSCTRPQSHGQQHQIVGGVASTHGTERTALRMLRLPVVQDVGR